ncbi:DUF397 domain-containing protein [Streptomyces bobili]|uniref:DUF397 domain-containing protein n=1 Tax=Streptomyces bobili TaxID=67280 RepID=UPI0036618202
MTEALSPFRKSSYSGQQGDCVEVAATTDDGRALRDSKRQDGPLIAVSPQAWRGFLRQFA